MHTESLEQLAQRANVLMQKGASMRVSAGRVLLEAKARVTDTQSSEGEPWRWIWRQWVIRNLEKSERDARKCIALASADDPEAAAEQEREQTRKAVAAHRQRERAGLLSPHFLSGNQGLEGETPEILDPSEGMIPQRLVSWQQEWQSLSYAEQECRLAWMQANRASL